MISAVILTKNEEKNIADCIASVSWCDEVIVIDDNSSDKTVEIAKKTKAKIFIHSMHDDFSAQRNFGLEKAKGDWILFVDADERVGSSLWYEIMQHTSTSIDEYSGFFIKRTDIIWGKKIEHGEVGNVKFIRLAKKNSGKWSGQVHETWKITGKIGELKNPIWHYPHRTVEGFLREINYYTTLRAEELYKEKKSIGFFGIFAYPSSKFFVNYLLKSGFRDAIPGLVIAIMMSFHSFLVRAKLWLLFQKDK